MKLACPKGHDILKVGRTSRGYCCQCRNDRQRNDQLKFHYGITIAAYQELFTKQNGNCAICETHQTKLKYQLAVDHNHATGVIRGLLCANCNTALGLTKENPMLLDKMKTYLTQI